MDALPERLSLQAVGAITHDFMQTPVMISLSMHRLLSMWLSASLSLFIVDALFDSLWFDGLPSLFLASAVLTLANITLKPILMLLSLPFIALTMGLAIPLINGFVLFFVAELLDGFHLSGYWMAVLAALAFSFVNTLVSIATGRSRVMIRRSGGEGGGGGVFGARPTQRPPRARSDEVIDVDATEKDEPKK